VRSRASVLIILVVVAGGLVAYALLRDGGASEGAPATTSGTQTATETQSTTPFARSGKLSMLAVDYRAAVGRLLDAGFFPDTFPVESAHPAGLVVGQVPSAKVRMRPGSSVQLNVSLGASQREQRTAPDLTGLGLADAIRRCAEAGFTCRTVNAHGPDRVVAGQRPAAGDELDELTQIKLTTR
jgi:PASTA domain-containing protein